MDITQNGILTLAAQKAALLSVTRKFVGNSFDVTYIQCEQPQSLQKVLFARRAASPRVQCGLGLEINCTVCRTFVSGTEV